MKLKVKDLTTEELKLLIQSVVQNTIEDVLEDKQALSSENYTNSIKEARQDYKDGKVSSFDEIFNAWNCNNTTC